MTDVSTPDPDGTGPQSRPHTQYHYDARNRRDRSIDPLGHTTSYTYFATNQTKSLTDPDKNTTSYTIDALGRVGTETTPLGTRSYRYAPSGNLAQKTDRLGRVTRYAYDGLDRRTAEQWFANATSSAALHSFAWSYNLDGTLASAGDTIADYDYTYDALGRVDLTAQQIFGINSQASVALTLDTNYDALSRRTSLSASMGNSLLVTNAYQYDANSRTTQVTQTGHNSVNGSILGISTKRVDFSYNAAGQFDGISRSRDFRV